MLYKIENGYADYSIVKFSALPKADFMEKILNIIDKQCFEIKLVIPETEESKPLEHDDVVCKIEQIEALFWYMQMRRQFYIL